MSEARGSMLLIGPHSTHGDCRPDMQKQTDQSSSAVRVSLNATMADGEWVHKYGSLLLTKIGYLVSQSIWYCSTPFWFGSLAKISSPSAHFCLGTRWDFWSAATCISATTWRHSLQVHMPHEQSFMCSLPELGQVLVKHQLHGAPEMTC